MLAIFFNLYQKKHKKVITPWNKTYTYKSDSLFFVVVIQQLDCRYDAKLFSSTVSSALHFSVLKIL